MSPDIPVSVLNLEISASVLQLINSIQIQNNIWMSLSGTAVVLVLLTWFRVSGLLRDANMTRLRWRPNVLILPLLLFVCAFIFGYLINMALTSYFVEIAKKWNTSGRVPITDAQKHFIDDYLSMLQWRALAQLCFNVLGVFALSIWLIVNLVILRRTECHKQQSQ